jgi:hypothetical protein
MLSRVTHPKTIAGKAIDSIRINVIWSEHRGGRKFWIKRRRCGSSAVVRFANLFFRFARNPVLIWPTLEQWQRWEIDSFQMLNGDAYHAFADGRRAVCAEHLPGSNLVERLAAGSLTPGILEAAAVELRHAHQKWSEHFDGPWSHGDPHLGNFIFDDHCARARMIDFEVVHERSLAASDRHANDVLVLLQDLAGRASASHWVPLASAFVNGYGCKSMVERLKRQLIVPNGVPGIWWTIRTSYIPTAELRRRMTALREVI